MTKKELYFPFDWEQMTEDEQKQWARTYVELCLDCYEKEYGQLPPFPGEEEFHRLWDEIMENKTRE
jgi:hypothetical protein